MKSHKIFALILALMMLATAIFAAPSASAETVYEPDVEIAVSNAAAATADEVKRGDFDGDGKITTTDSVYLLYNSTYGDFKFPVNHSGDLDGNGIVDSDDAIRLLYSYMFGQQLYPLPEVEGHLFLLPQYYYQYTSLNDSEKEAYNRIKEAVYSYENIVSLGDLNIQLERAKIIYRRFLADNPQCFWIVQQTYGISKYADETIARLKIFYTDGEVSDAVGTADRVKIEARRAAVDAEIAKVVAQIDPDWNEYKKELFIHDYLVDNMQYDQDAPGDSYIDSSRNVLKPAYSIYGAFINKLGVCEAYTEAFQTLCYAVGINANQVTGPGHVWNSVSIGENWYQTDVTWDDPIYTLNGEVVPYKRHTFFNITQAKMVSTEGHPAVDDPISLVVPECNTTFDASLYQ